jgi:hypothetical protein
MIRAICPLRANCRRSVAHVGTTAQETSLLKEVRFGQNQSPKFRLAAADPDFTCLFVERGRRRSDPAGSVRFVDHPHKIQARRITLAARCQFVSANVLEVSSRKCACRRNELRQSQLPKLTIRKSSCARVRDIAALNDLYSIRPANRSISNDH